MKSLLIVGSGQYGQLIREIAILNNFQKIDFLDDNGKGAIGKIKDLEELQGRYTNTICSIGNCKLRKEISSKITNKINIIHPSAIISTSAKLGCGCVIEAGSIISANTIIEDGCFICAGAVINHNSIIRKYSQIDCNAVIKGEVLEQTKVEPCTFWKG